MKILCVIESGTWVEHQIVGSLMDSGHTVSVYRYGPAVGEFYPRARHVERNAKNRALVDMADDLSRRSGLDLIFCYVYDDFLQPETARSLRRLGVPLVNYNVDMATQWYRQIRIARYFDRMLCAEPVNMPLLARYNPRVLHFPMAARPPAPAPEGESAFHPSAPVTFVGTPMPFRVALLSLLHQSGVPLAVYGKYWLDGRQASAPAGLEKTLADISRYTWPKLRSEGFAGLARALGRRLWRQRAGAGGTVPRELCHGFVPDGGMQALFARSKINLGLTRTFGDNLDLHGTYMIKLRDFEVPMAGGFYLVERAGGYDNFFKPGVEVETWETPGELIAKIHHYLVHEKERNQIAAAGKLRAVTEHTWERRFSALFAELGLNP